MTTPNVGCDLAERPKETKSTGAGSTWFQMIDLEQPEPEFIERPPVETETKCTQTELETRVENNVTRLGFGLFLTQIFVFVLKIC